VRGNEFEARPDNLWPSLACADPEFEPERRQITARLEGVSDVAGADHEIAAVKSRHAYSGQTAFAAARETSAGPDNVPGYPTSPLAIATLSGIPVEATRGVFSMLGLAMLGLGLIVRRKHRPRRLV
tara:strand:- start:318 stop:695 length:378 start_codon:yes stop_codon:yes gene_type:complete